jgi:rod shape determining protein RodA
MHKRYRLRNYDFKLIIYICALTVIGIFAIGSAKPALQMKQISGFALGLVLMIGLSLMDYHAILKLYWVLYVLNLIMLRLVSTMGTKVKGAQRWLQIGPIQFQPSETAKIIMILFFAAFVMKHYDKMKTFKYFLICLLLFLPIIKLVHDQPDLSTSLLLLAIFFVIMFIGGISMKTVLGLIAVAVPTFIILFALIMQPGQNVIEDYQKDRIMAFINPSEYATTDAYQQINSVMAIGSGKLTGKGYKNNEISSVKNGNFISEPQTDFIFAVIGEESGFVGSCTVIVLLILTSFECIIIARKASDMAGTVIAGGMAALIAFQGFMNIGVATQVMINTGLPLPFVSYGLTSLESLFIGMGFVLNVRLQARQ